MYTKASLYNLSSISKNQQNILGLLICQKQVLIGINFDMNFVESMLEINYEFYIVQIAFPPPPGFPIQSDKRVQVAYSTVVAARQHLIIQISTQLGGDAKFLETNF